MSRTPTLGSYKQKLFKTRMASSEAGAAGGSEDKFKWDMTNVGKRQCLKREKVKRGVCKSYSDASTKKNVIHRSKGVIKSQKLLSRSSENMNDRSEKSTFVTYLHPDGPSSGNSSLSELTANNRRADDITDIKSSTANNFGTVTDYKDVNHNDRHEGGNRGNNKMGWLKLLKMKHNIFSRIPVKRLFMLADESCHLLAFKSEHDYNPVEDIDLSKAALTFKIGCPGNNGDSASEVLKSKSFEIR